jgi:hypothetical protein
MKNIVSKATTIGFVVGIVMSFNLMFIGIGGIFAYSISLGFILDSLPLSEGMGWIIGPPFFVLVYTLYGAIVGLLIKKFGRKNANREA